MGTNPKRNKILKSCTILEVQWVPCKQNNILLRQCILLRCTHAFLGKKFSKLHVCVFWCGLWDWSVLTRDMFHEERKVWVRLYSVAGSSLHAIVVWNTDWEENDCDPDGKLTVDYSSVDRSARGDDEDYDDSDDEQSDSDSDMDL